MIFTKHTVYLIYSHMFNCFIFATTKSPVDLCKSIFSYLSDPPAFEDWENGTCALNGAQCSGLGSIKQTRKCMGKDPTNKDDIDVKYCNGAPEQYLSCDFIPCFSK